MRKKKNQIIKHLDFAEIIIVSKTHGILKAKIDLEDVSLALLFSWSISERRGLYYVVSYSAEGKRISLHRTVFKTSAEVIDHINGNPLDNRKSNLRGATMRENSLNRRGKIDSKTGVKGVYPKNKKFMARIEVNRKKIHLGVFETIQEASLAYENAAKFYFGDFARENKESA